MESKVEFDLKTIYAGHHRLTYRGVKTIKCPFDFVLFQILITQVKPDLIIEIGTHAGGTALYMADLLQLNGGGEIHTIDIVDSVTDSKVKTNANIKRFLGGHASYDLSIVSKFQNVMVIDDGSHAYKDVLNALNKFHNIVSIGSYYIVEDGIIDELGFDGYNGGPLRAIDEFLSNNNGFEVDRDICDLFGKNATFNPNGYLKRIN